MTFEPPAVPRIEAMPDGPKFLTLDIETMAAKAWIWGPLYDVGGVGLNQVIQHDRVICFAAKWLGQKRTHYYSEEDLGPEGLALAARDLLQRADYLITYNGQSFDHKHLNRLLLTHRVPAPASEPTHVDLMRLTKQKFRLLSNKLQNLVNELEVGSKMKHAGFDLWADWEAGVPKARKDMRRYCMHDVVLTERVFEIFREDGWLDKKIPRPGQVGNWDAEQCQFCGCSDWKKNGRIYNTVYTYQRYQCKGCQRQRKGERIT